MRVLLTGAGGFLGRNVAPALAERGYQVRGLFRAEPQRHLHGACSEFSVADIRDRAQVVAALDGCDACVHAAAAVSLLPSYSSAARQVTVGGTDTLLRATDVVGRQRIIHIGSASSFGFGTKSRPGTEESATVDGGIDSATRTTKTPRSRSPPDMPRTGARSSW